MAEEAVDTAVKARLAAHWDKCGVVPDLNTNQKLPAAPFLTVVYPVVNADQMSIGAPGANIWRETGVFLLVLHVERGKGAAAWLGWTRELASLFRGKSFDGVQTFAPTSAPLDNDNESGNFYQLSVAVPYQYDLIG